MNQEQVIPAGLKATRSAFRVLGGLAFFTAAAVFALFLFGALSLGMSREEQALLGNPLLGGFGVALIGFAAVLGVAGFIAAAAISRGKRWGRIAGIVLAVLILPLIPLGTALGAVALAGLLGAPASAWFSPRS
jgi:hypothetical protein